LSGTKNEEFSPLNLEHVFDNCFSLIEWPVRLPHNLIPRNRLDIDIKISDFGQGPDVAEDDNGAENSDIKARIVVLTAKSPVWNEQFEIIRKGSLLDDLLL